MTSAEEYRALTRRRVDELAGELTDLSHRILGMPELAFEEHNAARWVADAVACHGFAVQRGHAGLRTAIGAARGHGDLVIGYCAEYDACQEPGMPAATT